MGGVAEIIERARKAEVRKGWQAQGESGRQGDECLPPCLCVKGSVPKVGDSCLLSPPKRG